jgi:phage baseplate assembly protein W
MNASTGEPITGKEHLAQSIQDILTTPIGSRVMRRDYGSYVFELIDYLGNDVGKLRLLAATADAIRKWEPRITLKKLSVTVSLSGDTALEIEGQYLDDKIAFEVVL